MTPSARPIDFLPASYREQGVQKKNQLWRLVVVCMVGGVVASAALYQQVLRAAAQRELNELGPQRMAAEQQNARLAALQAELRRATQQANLHATLRQPWPRTQILRACLEGLPSAVTLSEIRILREAVAPAAVDESVRPSKRSAEKAEKVNPVEQDLAMLREELDGSQTVVVIRGKTADTPALHQWLSRLGSSPLLAKSEVNSIERSGEGRVAESVFTVRLSVKPSYGQPGGPAVEAAAPSSIATNDGKKS